MDINKHTATRPINDNTSVSVTIERGTWDEEIRLDGQLTGTVRTHLVNRTKINIVQNGAVVATGGRITEPNKTDKAKGAVGRLGVAGLSQRVVDIINEALAEADAAAPKTNRQIKIENAAAERKVRQAAWEKSPEGQADIEAMERHEWLMREMDNPNSDY